MRSGKGNFHTMRLFLFYISVNIDFSILTVLNTRVIYDEVAEISQIHRLQKGEIFETKKKSKTTILRRGKWCKPETNAAKQKAIVATSMVHYVILVFLHLRCYTDTKIMNGFKSTSFDKVMHALRIQIARHQMVKSIMKRSMHKSTTPSKADYKRKKLIFQILKRQ